MNLQAIREQVAVQLSGVDGLRAYAYKLEQIPAGNADHLFVVPGDPYVTFNDANAGGLSTVRLNLEVWVRAADMRTGSNRLDALLSAGTGESRSVIDALMGIGNDPSGVDHSLADEADDIVIDDAVQVRSEVEDNGERFLVAELGLRVMTERL